MPNTAAAAGEGLGRGAGRGRGRGQPLPGAVPPKARALRANPTLATLIAQLPQVFEGQHTFEARLGRRLVAPPTCPQTASLGGSSTLVNGGGVAPVGGPQLLQSQPNPLVGHRGLLNMGGGPPFLRSSASYDSGQFGFPPEASTGLGQRPTSASAHQVAGPGSSLRPRGPGAQLSGESDCLGARSGRAPDLVNQARVGFGRYNQIAPSNVSDAQILAPPGVQFWAQLASLPPLQTAQHVPPLKAPGLAVPAAAPAPSLAVPAAVSAPALASVSAAPAAVPALGSVPEEHPFQHSLASQNLTNSALHAQLARSGRGGDDALSGLLGSNAPDDLASPKKGGARGAASQETLKRDMFEHPRQYIRAIRENAKREMRASPDETESRCESMYLYLGKHVPFDKSGASAYMGFGLASIADYQRRGEFDKAELMTLLMLVAVEQACLDSGRWSLARAPLAQHSSRASERLAALARLADAVWTASAMAYTKDAAALNEVRKKTTAPQDTCGNKKIGGAKKETDGKTD